MSSDTEKLKICHVITRMIVGGAQENTLLSVVGQQEAGHEVVLLTGPSPGREGQLLQKSGISPHEVVLEPSLVRELDPVNDLRAYCRLKRFFRERQFDVVHTHCSKAGIIGRLAARAAGVPVVVHTVHGQAFHPYEKPWKNWIYKFAERWAAAKSDRIFAVAQAMIDQCVEAGIAPRDRYQVVYSGMDTRRFAEAKREPQLRRELGIPESARVIATVARLFPQKGYEFVIPAVTEVIQSHPETHLLVIGDGPKRPDYERELAESGVLDHVHFAGLIAPDEVCRYLAQADLLWHLSLHEGLPRAVVQALAEGIPAIGFRLDGTPEVVIDGETGFCTTPESVGEVVEYTRRIWEDPVLARRMGETGKARVLRQFDWRRMCETLNEAYLELVGRKTIR